MFRATTRSIEVNVSLKFQENESNPKNKCWFWSYTVEITNHSEIVVQLRSRHWRIVNSDGEMHEVRGAGVVGEEPILRSGESFRYTSSCPLDTASGFMSGFYQMQDTDGDMFDIAIPSFPLDIPGANRVLN